MSWVRSDREITPDLPHTPANAQLYDAVMVVVRRSGEIVAFPPSLQPGPVVCEFIPLSAHPLLHW